MKPQSDPEYVTQELQLSLVTERLSDVRLTYLSETIYPLVLGVTEVIL